MKQSLLGSIIQFIAQLSCLALMGTGVWCIFGNSIKNMVMEEHQYRKLERTISAKKDQKQSFIIKHIYRVLSTALTHDIPKSAAHLFVIGSAAVFIFSFLSLMKLYSIIFSLGLAVFIATFPYWLLRIKLWSAQINSSYDGDYLVTSITNEYKQHYFNMKNAIEKCAIRNDTGSYSKRNLYRLSLAIKAYQSEEELDSAIAHFVYAYNTEWAVLLGLNIKMAVQRGINVSSGLEDILKKLKASKEQIEGSKRYNSEAFAMIRVLLIPLYLGSIYVAVKTFGFSIEKFLEYQFLNPVGLRMGIVTFLLMALSFTALIATRKPKYDL